MARRRKSLKGSTKTVKGKTYKLNKNSRWERTQAVGELTTAIGGLALMGSAALGYTSLISNRLAKRNALSTKKMNTVFNNLRYGNFGFNYNVNAYHFGRVAGRKISTHNKFVKKAVKVATKLSRSTRSKAIGVGLVGAGLVTGGVLTQVASKRRKRNG